jgi:hypothetical protein
MKHGARGICWKQLFGLLMIFPVLAAGSALAMGSKRGESPPASSERAAESRITIQKILKNSADFVNKEILLEGTFQGWRGKCEDSTPLTRSDWVLKDESGCVYVSGKIPSGVSTTAPRGENLILSGSLKIKEGGKPYFEAKEVRLKE